MREKKRTKTEKNSIQSADMKKSCKERPVDQKEAFVCWLDDNESAFYEGDREASAEEVRWYLAQQAAADLE